MSDNLLIFLTKDHAHDVFSIFRSVYKTEYTTLEEKLLNLLEEIVQNHPIDEGKSSLVVEHVCILHILYVSFNEYFKAWLEALGVEDEYCNYRKLDKNHNILLAVFELEEKEYIEDLLDTAMNLFMDKKIPYGKKLTLLETINKYQHDIIHPI